MSRGRGILSILMSDILKIYQVFWTMIFEEDSTHRNLEKATHWKALHDHLKGGWAAIFRGITTRILKEACTT